MVLDNEKLQAWCIHVPLFNKVSRKESKIFPLILFHCLPNEWIRISMRKIYFFPLLSHQIYHLWSIIDNWQDRGELQTFLEHSIQLSPIFTVNWNKSTTTISLYNSDTPHPRRSNCNLKRKAKPMCVSVLVY